MESSLSFAQTARKINRLQNVMQCLGAVAAVLASLMIGSALIAFLVFFGVDSWLRGWVILLLFTILGVALSWPFRWKKQWSAGDLRVHCDIRAPEISSSPYLREELHQETQKQWEMICLATLMMQKKKAQSQLQNIGRMLSLPLLLMLVGFWAAPPEVPTPWSTVKSLMLRFQSGVELKVLEGKAKPDDPDQYQLSTSKVTEIEVLESNLVTLKFSASTPLAVDPQVVLMTRSEFSDQSQEFQRFRLAAQGASDQEQSVFGLSFVVSESVDLYIDVLSERSPLAYIQVKKLPVPKVELALLSELPDEPWPDDQPLVFQIQSKSEQPLQDVYLVMQSGERSSKELVVNVVGEDKFEIRTQYSLILEPYMESDFADVDIYAEVTDKSLPVSLVGRSDPIRVQTVSAYGRYRQTLDQLRSLKSAIDEAVESQSYRVDQQTLDVAEKSYSQSENSPFFDGLDRIHIEQFRIQTRQLLDADGPELLMQLSTDLNEFLFDHEAIDDKERDRDFFVAIRGFSRVIERAPDQRSIEPGKVAERIAGYLDDRTQRWDLRLKRLPPQKHPAQSAEVLEQKIFHQKISKAARLSQSLEGAKEALQGLSRTSTEYRAWIEALEQAEDEYRKEQEQSRQEGLASARDQLKELQKLQDEIAQELDRAPNRPQEDLAQSWPSTRMKQQSNIRDTGQLEAQLRSLSPTAGERIKAAQQSMQLTIEAGDEQDFAQAESGADLAVRLLRQAESAARKSQRQSQGSRKRRRVSGDGYYGQSIGGYDLEIRRDYQVDERYREEVLNDVREVMDARQGQGSPEERRMLNDYLRSVVR